MLFKSSLSGLIDCKYTYCVTREIFLLSLWRISVFFLHPTVNSLETRPMTDKVCFMKHVQKVTEGRQMFTFKYHNRNSSKSLKLSSHVQKVLLSKFYRLSKNLFISVDCLFKGAQAWEFFALVFCTKWTHLDVWLGDWGKKSIFLSIDPWFWWFLVFCRILSVR